MRTMIAVLACLVSATAANAWTRSQNLCKESSQSGTVIEKKWELGVRSCGMGNVAGCTDADDRYFLTLHRPTEVCLVQVSWRTFIDLRVGSTFQR